MNEEKKSSKTVHIVYLIIIFLLIGGGVGGFFYLKATYDRMYEEAVSSQNRIYEKAKKEYDSALDRILSEEEAWKEELSAKQDEVNKAYEKVEEVYAERQAEIDAEAARWRALSKDEQAAETRAIEYNEMVTQLRKTNKEYKALYIEYSKYLGKDIFNLGKDEVLAYTELYNKKLEIEQAYMASH